MKDFLSTIEAAEILGVSRVTLFNRIKAGEIKAMKVGRNYIVPRAEVMKFVKQDGLTQLERDEIDRGVDRVISEYGETLKLLKDH